MYDQEDTTQPLPLPDTSMQDAQPAEDTPATEKDISQSEEEFTSPDVIDYLAPSIVELDYNTAQTKLKELYSSTRWSDKRVAADKLAGVAELVNNKNNTRPEVKLEENALNLSQKMLDTTLSDEAKLKAIEDWRLDSKQKLFDTDDPAKLLSGKEHEQTIDYYATQLRRNVVGKDNGALTDGVARGINAALLPLTDTADLVLDTKASVGLQRGLEGFENPKYDNTLTAGIASGIGSVGGFAVSALVPGGPLTYLGATLASQAKGVYDTAYQTTKSHDAAKTALGESIPGILIGTFSDKLLGTSLGKAFQGTKGFQGALVGAAIGGVGNAAQILGTGLALESATGTPEFIPTIEELGKQTLIGAAVGGAFGGATSLVNKAKEKTSIDTAREEYKTAQKDTLQDNEKPGLSSKLVEDQLADNIEAPSFLSSRLAEADTIPAEANTSAVEGNITDKGEPDFAAQFLQEASDTPNRKLLPVINDAFTPQPFLQEIVRTLDGSLSAVDNPGRDTLGFYSPKPNSIGIRRTLFRDIDQAQRTMAHEIGHFVDYYNYRKENDLVSPQEIAAGKAKPGQGPITGKDVTKVRRQPLLEKISRVKDLSDAVTEEKALFEDAQALSSQWRPWSPQDSDQSFINYRNRTTEIQADVFSAIMNSPEWVQTEYPRVWEAFNKGLEGQPALNKIWTDVQEANTNPEKLYQFMNTRLAIGRKREAEIVQKSAEESILERKGQFVKSLKSTVDDGTIKFVNKYNVAKEVVRNIGKAGSQIRELASKLYNDLYRRNVSRQELSTRIDIPLNKLWQKADSLGFVGDKNDSLANLKNYERFNKKLYESNEPLENIKADGDTYKAALSLVDETLYSTHPNQEALSPRLKLEKTGQDLADELAKIHAGNLIDLKILSKVKDKLEKSVDPRAPAALELVSPDTFRVRRYLADPDLDVRSAERGLSFLKESLGPEKFAQLKQLSEDFHSILADPLFQKMQESGIVSGKALERYKQNKNTYITYNVLKYFQDDPRVSGSIREQVGTLDQIGDELAATIMKTKALIVRADYQTTQNSALKLAKLGDYEVKKVPLEFTTQIKKGEKVGVAKSVYEQAEKLQKENPDKSYLTQMEDGRTYLYEVNSNKWGKMFSPAELQNAPVLKPALQVIEGYNQLFKERELKTVFNPAFILKQRFTDRANEAIFARSFELPGLPFHVSPKIRGVLKGRDKALAKEYMQGIFKPETQFLIDTGVLAHNFGGEYGGGLGDEGIPKAESAIYERMGVEIPNQELASFPHRLTEAVSKTLDKTFFGAPIKAVGKLISKGAGKLREQAEFDEARTKIAGYLLAKDLKGLTPDEAAVVAREYFGTPDTLGGGTESTNLNKLFLFGRAHVNALRGVYNQFRDDPKGYSIQYAYHKFIPRMLVSSAIMTPIISTMFGDEEGKIYKKFLDKIPEFDKGAKLIVPFGFSDGAGNFKGFNVKSQEVGLDWKAKYLRLPLSRELFTVDTLTSPVFKSFEELLDTGTINAKHFAQNSMSSLNSAFVGNITPALMGMYRSGQLIGGYNPTDFFRNKGVLSRDVAESGTFLEKTYDYLSWSAYYTAPGIFSSQLKASKTDSLDPFDYAAKIPLVGPSLKAVIGSSNYGDYELGLKGEQAKVERDADIRLSLKENTRALFDEYRKGQGLTSRLGKGWEQQVSPETVRKIHGLNNWHAHVYQHSFNELRSEYEKGDDDASALTTKQLEDISTSYAKSIGILS